MHGVVDKRAAIVERNDANAFRKARGDLGDLLFYRIDYLKGVGSVARYNNAANRLLAILIENATPELGSQLHAGDIAYVHGSAVSGRDWDVLNVFQLLNQSEAAHHVLAITHFHHLGAHIVVATLHSREHVPHWD